MLGFGALGQFAIGEYNRETVAYALQCSAGSFTLTGVNVTLAAGRVLYAGQFIYITRTKQFGFAALGEIGLGQSSSEQSTDQVTFRLDGPQLTKLTVGRVIIAGTGSYALTGIDAGLLYDRKLLAGVGSYALTGIAAGLIADRFLYAGVGSYALSGVSTDFAIARRKLYAFPRSGSVTRGITRSGYDPVKVRAYGG